MTPLHGYRIVIRYSSRNAIVSLTNVTRASRSRQDDFSRASVIGISSEDALSLDES